MAQATFEVQLAVNAKEFIASLKAAQQAWAAFAGRLQESQGALWNTTVLGLQLAWSGKALTTGLAGAARQADVFRINLLSLGQAAANIGESITGVTDAVTQVARDLAVPMETVAQAMAMLLRRGYGVEQATQLLYRFADAAVNIGKDIDQGILKGAQAVAQELSRLLNEMGIPENVSDAIRNYARNLGLASTALTDAQRRAAIFDMIMTSTSDKVGLAQVALSGFIGAIQRLRAEAALFVREFGKGVGAFFAPLIEGARLALAALNALPPQLRQLLGFLSAMGATISLVGGLAMLTLSNVQRFVSTVGSTISGAIQATKEFIRVWIETRNVIDRASQAGQGIFVPFLRSLGLVEGEMARFRRMVATMEAASPFAQRGVSAVFIPSLDFRRNVFGTYTQFASLSNRVTGDIDALKEAFVALQQAGLDKALPSFERLNRAMADVAQAAGIAGAGALGFFEVLKRGDLNKLSPEVLAKTNTVLRELKDTLGNMSKAMATGLGAALAGAGINKRITSLQALNATMAKLGISFELLPKPTERAARAMQALGIAAESPITALNRFIRLVQSGALQDPIMQRNAMEAARYFGMLGRQLEKLRKTPFWDALVDDEAFAKFSTMRRKALEGIDAVLEAIMDIAQRRPLLDPGQMLDLAALNVAATQITELGQRLKDALIQGADPAEIRRRYGVFATAVSNVAHEIHRLASVTGSEQAKERARELINELMTALESVQMKAAKVAQAFPAAIFPYPVTGAERRALRKFIDEYTAAVSELLPSLRERIRLAAKGIDFMSIPAEVTPEKLEELKTMVANALIGATAALSMGVRTSINKLVPITIDEFEKAVADVFSEAGITARVLFEEGFIQGRSKRELIDPSELMGALVGIELISRRTGEKVALDLREIAAEAQVAPERAAQALTALFATLDKQADKFMLAQARALESTNLIVASMASGLANLADKLGLNKLGEAIRSAFDRTTLLAFASTLDATVARNARQLTTLKAQFVALGGAIQAAMASVFLAPIGRATERQATANAGFLATLAASIANIGVAIGRGFNTILRTAISGVGQLAVAIQALANLIGGALLGSLLLLATVPVFRVSFFNAIGGAIALVTGAFKGLYNAVVAAVTTLRDVGRAAVEAVPGVNFLAWALGVLAKSFTVGLQSIGDLLRLLGLELEQLGKRARLAVLLRIPEERRSPIQDLEIFNLQRDLNALDKQFNSILDKLERRWKQAFAPRNISFERYVVDQIKSILTEADRVEQAVASGGLGAKEAEKAYEGLAQRVRDLREELTQAAERYKIPGLDRMLGQLSAIEGQIKRGHEALTPFLEELRKFAEDVSQLELRVHIAGTPEARRNIEQLSLDLAKALEKVDFAENLTIKDKETLKEQYIALFGELRKVAEQEFVYEFTRLLSRGQMEIERSLLETVRSPMERLQREMQLELQTAQEEIADLVRRYGEGTPEAFQIMVQGQQRLDAIRKVYLERMRQQALEEQRILRELRINIARELLALQNQYVNTYGEIVQTLRRIGEAQADIAQGQFATNLRRMEVFGQIFPDQAQVRQAELALRNLKDILAQYRDQITQVFALRRQALMSEWALALEEAHNEFINRMRDLERQISDPGELARAQAQVQEAYNKRILNIQRNYSAQLQALNLQLSAELVSIDQQLAQARQNTQERYLGALEARYRRHAQAILESASAIRQAMDTIAGWRFDTADIGGLVDAFRYVRDQARGMATDSKATAEALNQLRQEAAKLGEELASTLANRIRAARDAITSLVEAYKNAYISLLSELDPANAFKQKAFTSSLPDSAITNLVNALKGATEATTGLGQAADNTFRQELVSRVTRQGEAVLGLSNNYKAAQEEVTNLKRALEAMGLTNEKAIQDAAKRYDALQERLAELTNKLVVAQAAAPFDPEAAKRVRELQATIARVNEDLAKSATAKWYLELSAQFDSLTKDINKLSASVGKLSKEDMIRLNASIALGAAEVEYLRQQTELYNLALEEEERNLRLAALTANYKAKVLAILQTRNAELAQINALTLNDEKELQQSALDHAEARDRLTKATNTQAESLYRLVTAMNELKRAQMEYDEALLEASAIQARVEGGTLASIQKELQLADLRLENAAKRLQLAKEELQVAGSDDERAQALRNLARAELDYARALEERQEALRKFVQAQETELERGMKAFELYSKVTGFEGASVVTPIMQALGKVNILLRGLEEATGALAEELRAQVIEALNELIDAMDRLASKTLEVSTGLAKLRRDYVEALGGFVSLESKLDLLTSEAQAFLGFVDTIGDLSFIPTELLQRGFETLASTLRSLQNELKEATSAWLGMIAYLDGPYATRAISSLAQALRDAGVSVSEIARFVEDSTSKIESWQRNIADARLAWVNLGTELLTLTLPSIGKLLESVYATNSLLTGMTSGLGTFFSSATALINAQAQATESKFNATARNIDANIATLRQKLQALNETLSFATTPQDKAPIYDAIARTNLQLVSLERERASAALEVARAYQSQADNLRSVVQQTLGQVASYRQLVKEINEYLNRTRTTPKELASQLSQAVRIGDIERVMELTRQLLQTGARGFDVRSALEDARRLLETQANAREQAAEYVQAQAERMQQVADAWARYVERIMAIAPLALEQTLVPFRDLVEDILSGGQYVVAINEATSLIKQSLNEVYGELFGRQEALLRQLESYLKSLWQAIALTMQQALPVALQLPEGVELPVIPRFQVDNNSLQATVDVRLDTQAIRAALQEAIQAAAIQPEVNFNASIVNNVNLDAVGKELYERIKSEVLREVQRALDKLGR